VTRYAFDDVRAALRDEWGLSLYRGGAMADDDHDGRWTTEYSRTGYLVGGNLSRRGFGYQRFRSLVDVVDAYELDRALAAQRPRRAS
jgi:hypothetical protein